MTALRERSRHGGCGCLYVALSADVGAALLIIARSLGTGLSPQLPDNGEPAGSWRP